MDSAAQSESISTREHHDHTLLPPKTVASMLSVSVRALEAWRYRGEGPPFIRISARCVRYRRSAIEAWLNHRHRSD